MSNLIGKLNNHIVELEERIKELEGEPRGYEGWQNFETWSTYTWLTGTEDDYQYCVELAQEAKLTNHPRSALADSLKDWLEANSPLADADVFTDLLNAAISNVDWFDIADAFLGEGLEMESQAEPLNLTAGQ